MLFMVRHVYIDHHLKRPNIRIRALDSLRTQLLTAQLEMVHHLLGTDYNQSFGIAFVIPF